MGSAPSLTDATLVAVFNSFFTMMGVLFVHRNCVADGGTTGELKALYTRKIPFVAISEFGGISGGGIAGYNCI